MASFDFMTKPDDAWHRHGAPGLVFLLAGVAGTILHMCTCCWPSWLAVPLANPTAPPGDPAVQPLPVAPRAAEPQSECTGQAATPEPVPVSKRGSRHGLSAAESRE